MKKNKMLSVQIQNKNNKKAAITSSKSPLTDELQQYQKNNKTPVTRNEIDEKVQIMSILDKYINKYYSPLPPIHRLFLLPFAGALFGIFACAGYKELKHLAETKREKQHRDNEYISRRKFLKVTLDSALGGAAVGSGLLLPPTAIAYYKMKKEYAEKMRRVTSGLEDPSLTREIKDAFDYLKWRDRFKRILETSAKIGGTFSGIYAFLRSLKDDENMD